MCINKGYEGALEVVKHIEEILCPLILINIILKYVTKLTVHWAAKFRGSRTL